MAEINTDDVLSLFALYCGISNDEAAIYKPLCSSAVSEISARERENCGEESADALCRCAAALAFYRKALIDSGSGKGSFTAGDIKITESTANLPAAKQFLQNTLSASSAYLKDNGFVFEGIDA